MGKGGIGPGPGDVRSGTEYYDRWDRFVREQVGVFRRAIRAAAGCHVFGSIYSNRMPLSPLKTPLRWRRLILSLSRRLRRRPGRKSMHCVKRRSFGRTGQVSGLESMQPIEYAAATLLSSGGMEAIKMTVTESDAERHVQVGRFSSFAVRTAKHAAIAHNRAHQPRPAASKLLHSSSHP